MRLTVNITYRQFIYYRNNSRMRKMMTPRPSNSKQSSDFAIVPLTCSPILLFAGFILSTLGTDGDTVQSSRDEFNKDTLVF